MTPQMPERFAVASVGRRRATSVRGLIAGASALAGGLALPAARPAAGQERFADEEEALVFLLALERVSVAFYREGLGRFDAAAFGAVGLPADAYPMLETIRDQEEAHVSALADIVGDGSDDGGGTSASDVGDDVDAFLAEAAALKKAAVAAYAGAAPVIKTRRALRTVLGIHSVEARHAASLNALVGRPPFPDAIDAPAARGELRQTRELERTADGTPSDAASAASDGVPSAGNPALGLNDPRFAGIAADAAARLGVPEEEIRTVRVEAREWPDAALGCPEPGGIYAQVLTPGYVVVVEGQGRELQYHTDEAGAFVSC